MARRLLPLAVAIVLVLGRKKKPSTESGGNAPDAPPGDPAATYTLKIRTAAQGDKTEVSGSETTEEEVAGRPGKEVTQKKYEYTEHVLELPAGQRHPTKLTRAYKTAQSTNFKTKQVEPLVYQGKTVAIEKKGGQYEYSAEGRKLSLPESLELGNEFRNKEKDSGGPDRLLPKQPVKVGDGWTLDAEAMKAFMGGTDVDPARSKFNCKLVRMYTQDGRQWGVIEFDVELVVVGKANASGSLKFTGRFDGVLDGSARDGTMTASLSGSFTGLQNGKQFSGTLSGTTEKTVKMAK